MISAAAAPAARADDVTDILNNVQAIDAAGQADFTAAEAEFATGTGGVPDGLAEFLAGINNDDIVAPDELLYGGAQALANAPITGLAVLPPESPPTDLADALSVAQLVFNEGLANFQLGATALTGGDLPGALLDDLSGVFYSFDAPLEYILTGGVDQLLGV